MEKKMYLWTDNIKTKWKSKKLNHKSIESFIILKNIKNLSYELKLSAKMRIYFVFYVFMFQQCNQDISIQITETLIELNNKYEVETILGKRTISEKSHYLIKWKKYNISENIWEPRDNLKNCVRMLWHFEKRWRDFHFHSLFHHYHQWALWQGTRPFAQHNSAINLESFINKWFWQKVKFISLQQQQAQRTALYECDSETFRINQHTHNCVECKWHTENMKTSLYKKWCLKNNTDKQIKWDHYKDESSQQDSCVV